MNLKTFVRRANKIAQELVMRGYLPSGWPWGNADDVQEDIADIVNGKITNAEFEAKYPPKYLYETRIYADGSQTTTEITRPPERKGR